MNYPQCTIIGPIRAFYVSKVRLENKYTFKDVNYLSLGARVKQKFSAGEQDN